MQGAYFREAGFNELEPAMKIYDSSFPPEEKQPLNVKLKNIQSNKERLYVAVTEEGVAAMALLFTLLDGFDLLDTLAVKREERGKGIGTGFVKYLSSMGRQLLLEVEDPSCGERRDQKKLRVMFYRKNGGKLLANVRYILPPLSGGEPTRMILMALTPRSTLNGATVRRMILKIYTELYGLHAENALVQQTLNFVPKEVALE
ncbi:MAG: GNAT family N-acetyltransferase [Nitrososphaerota archaeon]|jgi:GNAT superfamily N-acetyltransferase|nr:GNAT family N-acetyltransferase [Nitrososphaerota archaeon]MDG6932547.1 GNAT family N-acetyltransferase [Nitrososphaerota archaeon]MDG6936691.1 GNAT family N-acetyltransferase [Nitrososphaerota archaeon]MDG6944132.1 GNAT family N-acetyltransferase [Nitrososphaerota archaeon]